MAAEISGALPADDGFGICPRWGFACPRPGRQARPDAGQWGPPRPIRVCLLPPLRCIVIRDLAVRTPSDSGFRSALGSLWPLPSWGASSNLSDGPSDHADSHTSVTVSYCHLVVVITRCALPDFLKLMRSGARISNLVQVSSQWVVLKKEKNHSENRKEIMQGYVCSFPCDLDLDIHILLFLRGSHIMLFGGDARSTCFPCTPCTASRRGGAKGLGSSDSDRFSGQEFVVCTLGRSSLL